MGKTNTVGKITVKHYLNTSIESENKPANKKEYPIYVLITANRRTTRIKSLTDLYFTEKKFDEYINNPSLFDFDIDDDDKTMEDVSNWGKIHDLQMELEAIEKIIEYCISNRKLQIGKFKTSEVIEFYSMSFVHEFGGHINHMIGLRLSFLEHPETAPIALYLEMNHNPHAILSAIKAVTHFDISRKLDNKKREIINSFNEFYEHSYPDSAYSMLIHWYNGDLKRNYLISSIVRKTEKNNKVIELLNIIGKNLEDSFWKKQ